MNTDSAPSFPFYISTESRPLSESERSVVLHLLSKLDAPYQDQVSGLSVVGRCGCGKCPTVFFLPHAKGDDEHDLVSYIGRDTSGGLVAAVLTEKSGRLSQLEFYSVDGHDPIEIPIPESLEPYI
jgi:hypothetical protein